MSEELLQYLWKYRLYKPEIYKTCDGQVVEIINPGVHNFDSGPDFFNAKIKIGGTLWAGNVEIHNKSSDWNKHGHNLNKSYDNVILHVVTINDEPTFNSSKIKVPVWQMPLEPSYINNYQSLIANKEIPCGKSLSQINQFEISNWIERMTIEKLEIRVDLIRQMLNQYKNNWDEVFYILLVRNFGFGTNSQPFEQLAKLTPWKIITKTNKNLYNLEALFLGQAGFLSKKDFLDEHIKNLQTEYEFMSKKYNITGVSSHHWKFLRLRPSNFPTLRLAQLSNLFFLNKIPFANILDCQTIDELINLLNVKASSYWDTHYRPNVESPYQPKQIGKTSSELIIINTIAPLLFAFGKIRDNNIYCQNALQFLEALKPEKNKIISGWSKFGITVLNAFQTQGLLHLNKNFCLHYKCIHCRIGHLVISKTNS